MLPSVDLRCPTVSCGGYLARGFSGAAIELYCHKCKMEIKLRRREACARNPLQSVPGSGTVYQESSRNT